MSRAQTILYVVGTLAAVAGGVAAGYAIANMQPFTREQTRTTGRTFESDVQNFADLPAGREWQALSRKSADAHLVDILPVDSTPLSRVAGASGAASNMAYQLSALRELRAAWNPVDNGLDLRCVYCLWIKESGWSGLGCHRYNAFNMKCGGVIYGNRDLILQKKIWSGVREAKGIYLLTDRLRSFDAYTAFGSHQQFAQYAARVLRRSYPRTIQGWYQGGLEGLVAAERALAEGDWSNATADARERGARAYWKRMQKMFGSQWDDREMWSGGAQTSLARAA